MTMPSLFSRVSQFARSKQGKELIDQGKDFASKPANRRKITSLFSRGGDGGAKKTRRSAPRRPR
jgi:hypothetical protein